MVSDWLVASSYQCARAYVVLSCFAACTDPRRSSHYSVVWGQVHLAARALWGTLVRQSHHLSSQQTCGCGKMMGASCVKHYSSCCMAACAGFGVTGLTGATGSTGAGATGMLTAMLHFRAMGSPQVADVYLWSHLTDCTGLARCRCHRVAGHTRFEPHPDHDSCKKLSGRVGACGYPGS